LLETGQASGTIGTDPDRLDETEAGRKRPTATRRGAGGNVGLPAKTVGSMKTSGQESPSFFRAARFSGGKAGRAGCQGCAVRTREQVNPTVRETA